MSPEPPPGVRAPAFTVPLASGGTAALADLVLPGGGVLLFVKPSCPASELVAERLVPLADALRREDRRLLAILQGTGEEARAFQAAHAAGLAVAWEAGPFEVSRSYEVSAVPTLFLIDGAGVIAERLEGFVKSEYLALGPSAEQALSLSDIPPVLLRPEELPAAKAG